MCGEYINACISTVNDIEGNVRRLFRLETHSNLYAYRGRVFTRFSAEANLSCRSLRQNGSATCEYIGVCLDRTSTVATRSRAIKANLSTRGCSAACS